MHRALLLPHILGQLHAPSLTADISWESMQAARAGVVGFDHILELFLPPAGDVDFGAVGDERLRDHEADAGAATCDDGGEVRAVEEGACGELVVCALGCWGTVSLGRLEVVEGWAGYKSYSLVG